LIDDMGWTDLGCFGSRFYRTPNIDRLAAGGMRFTSAYAACTVCSPTRASIMTGKYPARLHLTDWIPGRTPPGLKFRIPAWTPYLRLEETTIAEMLKPFGYTSASIGKWHLGGPEYYPEKQGFDKNVAGSEAGSPPSYFVPYGIPTLRDGAAGEYVTDRLTDEALHFLDGTKGRPFFLYLAHFAVHTPIQAKADITAEYRPRVQPGQGHSYPEYAAMIDSVDQSVGRVVRKLQEMGQASNTVIVFMSDNGGVISRPHITSNEPLRGEKGSFYEGGVRVPLIVHWPGVTKPGSSCDTPVISIDFFPTLAEIAGGKLPPDVDGRSLVPLLRGQTTLARESIYWHYPHYNFHQALVPLRPGGAIRKGDFKLIEHYEDGWLELFDLRNDIGERRNLADRMPAKAAELKRDLAAWRQSVGAQMPIPDPANYNPAATEEWMRNRGIR
jgi:arylsulfatase A